MNIPPIYSPAGESRTPTVTSTQAAISTYLAACGITAQWVRRSTHTALAFPHAACWRVQRVPVPGTPGHSIVLIYPEDQLIDADQVLAQPIWSGLPTKPHPEPWPENTVFPGPDWTGEIRGMSRGVWFLHPPETDEAKIWYLQTPVPDYYLACAPGDHRVLFPHAQLHHLTHHWPVSEGDPVLAECRPDPGTGASLAAFFPERIRRRLEDVHALPAFPPIGRAILELKTNPDAQVRDLVAVISQDPSLAAQVMAWSASPYYGYSGRLGSLEEAIIKVLGYDRTLNLALGVVLSRSFHLPEAGSLGLHTYWRSALYTALCAEGLYMGMRHKMQVSKGMVYLCGLLHNIGHLAIGHLFPALFEQLNQWIGYNPHVPVARLEQHIMGTTHHQVGGWLLQRWRLPEPVVRAVRDHDHIPFGDPLAVYPALIGMATRLVSADRGGEACYDEPVPPRLLGFLGLEPAQLQETVEKIRMHRDALEQLCASLVAAKAR